MPLIAGVDEAGYGPNLGPLVVAGTSWETPAAKCDFDHDLKTVVSRNSVPGRLQVCDSKRVSGGLAGLEATVLAALACTLKTDTPPRSWNELQAWFLKLPEQLPVEPAANPEQLPLTWRIDEPETAILDHRPDGSLAPRAGETPVNDWVAKGPLVLPVAVAHAAIGDAAASLRGGLAGAGYRLHRIAAAVIYPRKFNELLDRHGNKSRLLGAVTMQLVRKLVENVRRVDDSVTMICDRQGGRQRYAPLLRSHWPNHKCEITSESPAISQYRLIHDGPPDESPRKLDISFRVGGEGSLPVALASMTAKYFRELAMLQWNSHWQARIAGIRPTAGYPVDAIRFRNDLRKHVGVAELPDEEFWRAR